MRSTEHSGAVTALFREGPASPGSLILPNVCLGLCLRVLKHGSQKSKSSQFLHLNLDPLMGNTWQPSHLFQEGR